MILKSDCRHFPGSRPCRFNKESGQTCPDCAHYQRKGFRILITKLDALGDVLRTTALLPGLKDRYPGSYIVWVTKAGAVDLFRNNPYVDELWVAETDAIPRLKVESFDLVINPDADKWTAALATMADAGERLGMALDRQGNVIAVNAEAEEWLQMGAFDYLKKANRKTYQQIIYDIACLPYAHQRPVLCLTDTEREWGLAFLRRSGWDSARKLIGINLGGGGRWKNKRWTEEHIVTFSKMVSAAPDLQVLVIGGPWEHDLMERLRVALPAQALFSETDRTLRETASLIAACHTLVTGDTLALHIATALNTRVIALFGPTSATEIELYGNGTSLIPELQCCCCYRQSCKVAPNCMASIMPTHVWENLPSYPAET